MKRRKPTSSRADLPSSQRTPRQRRRRNEGCRYGLIGLIVSEKIISALDFRSESWYNNNVSNRVAKGNYSLSELSKCQKAMFLALFYFYSFIAVWLQRIIRTLLLSEKSSDYLNLVGVTGLEPAASTTPRRPKL